MGTKQQTTEFGRVSGIWFIDRIMQLTQWVFFQFRYCLSIYPIQYADDFLRGRIKIGIPGNHRAAGEFLAKSRRHQLGIFLLPAALAEQNQSVLRQRQMSDLPTDVGGFIVGLSKSVMGVDIFQQGLRVGPGCRNLVNRHLQLRCIRHGSIPKTNNRK